MSYKNSIVTRLVNSYLRSKVLAPGPLLTIMMATIGLLFFISGINDYKQNYRISHNYLQTTCNITQVFPDQTYKDSDHQTEYTISIGDSTASKHILCPKAQATYMIDNLQYSTSVTLECVQGEQEQHAMLASYTPNQTRKCWYDPKDPTQVSLGLSTNNQISPFIWMILGLFITIWFCYHYFYPLKYDASNPTTPITLGKINEVNDAIKRTNNIQTKSSNSVLIKPIFLIAGLASAFLAFQSLKKDWEINHQYLKTMCRVINKELQTYDKHNSQDKDSSTMYQALINIYYNIDNIDYNTWISPSRMRTSSASSERETLDQYLIGHDYTCWYNPNNPKEVVLKRGYGILNIFINLVFIIVSLFILIPSKYNKQ